MTRSVEKRGKTVEDAVQLALEDLGAEREQCQVTILEEPKTGWLGLIGGREALVRVEHEAREASVESEQGEAKAGAEASQVMEETPSPLPSKADQAHAFLTEVLMHMDIDAKVDIIEDTDHIFCEISGDDVGALIGRRGQTLTALQYLTKLVTGRHPEDRRRLTVDIEGYRKRREQRLRTTVKRMAEQVAKTGSSVELEPMDAHERKVVHMALQDYPGIETHSEGSDPYRKVVISPASE